jgi:hypothetical protein
MYKNNRFILKKNLTLIFKVVLFFILLIVCSLLPPIYEKIFGNPELIGKFLVEVDEGFSVAKTVIDSFKSTSYSVYKDKSNNYEITWIDRVSGDLCLNFTKLDENLKKVITKTILDSGKSSYVDHEILVSEDGKTFIFYSAISNGGGENILNFITIDKKGQTISSSTPIYEGKYIDDINACFDSKNDIYLVFSDLGDGIKGFYGIKISSDGGISDAYKLNGIPQGKAKKPQLEIFDNKLYLIWHDTREDPRRPFIYLGVFTQDFEKILEKKVGRTIIYTTNIQAVHVVDENGIYIFRSGLITEEDKGIELGGYNDIIMDIFDLNCRDIIRGKFITRTAKWSYNPHISFNKDKIHIVWVDNRNDRLDTYYSFVDKDGNIIKDQIRVNDKGKDTYLPKVFSYEKDYAQFFWIGFNPDQTNKIIYKDNKNIIRTYIFNKLGIGAKKEYFFGIGGYLFSLILSSLVSILLNIGAILLTLILSILVINYLMSKLTDKKYYGILNILIIFIISSLSRFYFKVPQKFLFIDFSINYTIIGYLFASIFAFLFYKSIDFKNQNIAEIVTIVLSWFIFEGIFSIFPAILRIFI